MGCAIDQNLKKIRNLEIFLEQYDQPSLRMSMTTDHNRHDHISTIIHKKLYVRIEGDTT